VHARRPVHEQADLVRFHGLLVEIVGPELHRPDRVLAFLAPGHHDHPGLRHGGQDLAQGC
jgi:hypothetical protein